MANIHDIIAYILQKYPTTMADELSNARVTKMVYLADWHSCLRSKGQISNISWYFDNFGPFVWDVKESAVQHPELFKVSNETNMYGSRKTMFKLLKTDYQPNLSSSEIKSLDHIIKVASKKYWDDFIKLVYSTHPIASSDRYTFLDLGKKAKEYKALRDA